MAAAEDTQDATGYDPQEIAMRAEELRGHLDILGRQIDVLSSVRSDKERALATLRGLKATQPGDEALLPVGGNTFVAARLAENEQVIMGVGADYAMPRPISDAITSLEQDIARLQDELASLNGTAGRVEAEYSQLVQVLRSMRTQ